MEAYTGQCYVISSHRFYYTVEMCVFHVQDCDSIFGLPLCLEDLQLLWTGPVGPYAAGTVLRYKQFMVLDEHDGLGDYMVMLFFLRKSLQHVLFCRGAPDSKLG